MSGQSSSNNCDTAPSSPPAGERTKVRGRKTTTQKTTAQAKRLRKKPTPHEAKFWKLLRDRRFEEFKFRRQHPIDRYVLDFYCPKAKLAIELDGSGHGFPSREKTDRIRDQFFESKGIKVLRFWNHQLGDELEAIRFEIWYALMERTGKTDKIAGFKLKPPPSSGLRPPSPS